MLLQEKLDKIVNTYETDPEFALFQQRLAGAPAASSSSANTSTASVIKGGADEVGKSSGTMTLEEKLKTNPLLQFLRERAEKRLRVKSVLSSKKGKGMTASSSSILASASESTKSKSKKNKKKKEKEAKAAALKGKDGENVGEDGKKKKKVRPAIMRCGAFVETVLMVLSGWCLVRSDPLDQRRRLKRVRWWQ